MNKEEKARAYDEALVKAKKYMDDGYTVLMPDLFPELRESEDEKKVKGFIDTLREVSCFAGNEYLGVEIADCIGWFIDWLEKQKEQKDFQAKVEQRMEYLWDKLPDAHRVEESNCTPEEWKALGAYMELEMNFDKGSEEKQKEPEKEELVYCLNGLMQEYIKEGEDENEKEHRLKCYKLFWDALEDTSYFEQKEQKHPNGCFTCDEYKKGYEAGRLNGFTAGYNKAIKEQKPDVEICPHSIKSKSYKENGYPIEDCDYGLEIAYDILEKTFGEVRGYQTDDGIREHQTAIEAVRKAKEQKPAEWSEEDEEMLEYIIGDVNDAKQLYTTQAAKDMADKEIAWLKSLCPSWKPTEDEERLINTSISFLKDFADKGYENAVECIDWLKSKLNGNTCK